MLTLNHTKYVEDLKMPRGRGDPGEEEASSITSMLVFKLQPLHHFALGAAQQKEVSAHAGLGEFDKQPTAQSSSESGNQKAKDSKYFYRPHFLLQSF